MTFIIATNNQNKLIELKRILNPLGIEAKTAKQLGINLDDVKETGKTFSENARLKAVAACDLAKIPAIADDSGLSVDALNGSPGVFSARYAGENASDIDRINKLLDEMKNIPQNDRGAHFTSSICCVFPNGDIITAQGKCYGKITDKPYGENGFGYDPIFLYENKTFAQMTKEEKDCVGHRGNAIRSFSNKLIKYLEENK